jgi:Kef-type K+ transport system membrane component KefB
MKMTKIASDEIVSGVLDRMDRHARMVRLAILAAAMVEGLLMVIALLKVDWKNQTQVLLFLFAVLGYTIVALGMVALGAHVSRVGARVVAALEGARPA